MDSGSKIWFLHFTSEDIFWSNFVVYSCKGQLLCLHFSLPGVTDLATALGHKYQVRMPIPLSVAPWCTDPFLIRTVSRPHADETNTSISACSPSLRPPPTTTALPQLAMEPSYLLGCRSVLNPPAGHATSFKFMPLFDYHLSHLDDSAIFTTRGLFAINWGGLALRI